MTGLRAVLVPVAAIVVAALLQVGLLAGLALPGAAPDLVLVVVAAIAVGRGPGAGAIAGFGAGLLVDLMPPSTHAAGQWALVLTLAGYLAGYLGDERLRTGARVALVGALAALSVTTYVGLTALLGAAWPTPSDLGLLVGSAAVYGAMLAIIVLPLAVHLFRRTAMVARTAW